MNKLHNAARHDLAYLALDQIQTDPRNPRDHKDRHIKALARSIGTFGFNVPILIDDKRVIIAGHGRYHAARLAGLTEVPVIYLHHLNEHQRHAYMIADNRLHDLSSWNRDNLASILLELSEADLDFDIEVTGFSVAEIDLMLIDPEEEEARDNALPDDGPAVATLNELWLLGNHRLLCADALRSPSYVRLMEDKQADAVITDPPFNVPINGHVGGLGKVQHRPFVQGVGEMNQTEFTAFLSGAMRNAADMSREGSLHYWAMDWRHLHELILAASSVYQEQINLCV